MTALLATLFIPLIGFIILMFFGKENIKAIKLWSLFISLAAFVASIFVYLSFDASNPDFQFVYELKWIEAYDAGFRIGLDGMSLLLVLLTTFITPIALLASFDSIKQRHKIYYGMVLLLQFGMTGVFVALDLFLFYVFWEIILIPMYFIIGIWGGKDRLYATVKFFLYTVVGSLFMLVGVVWLGYYVGGVLGGSESNFTTNFLTIQAMSSQIPFEIQKWLFWAFALSFLIKVPLFPFHTWLPDAHTEAPTPGSVILAGVLLKMGTYGLIRFNLDLFPHASIEYASLLSIFAVIGIIYGALLAIVQTDVKRLVAYSSVSHMGFIVLGIFSITVEGVQGGIIQMVSHGLATGMLFLLVGIIYERRHTRNIADFGGIARVMPNYALFFGIAMFASVGLPGLNGFVGEYLTLLGAFKSPFLNSYWYTVIGTTGVIFAAVYLLWMYQRVFFGTPDNPANKALPDINRTEWWTLAPIVVFIVWIGVYPSTFLKISEASTTKLIQKIEIIKFGTTNYALPENDANTNNEIEE